jgi:hypothetical protein
LVGDRLQNQLIRKIKNVPRRREAKHTRSFPVKPVSIRLISAEACQLPFK